MYCSKTEGMADLGTFIKKDFMVKRSMMKSWLIKKANYKGRWFVLTKQHLCYYDGSLEVGWFLLTFPSLIFIYNLL